jgi:hypothetical protein
MTCRVATLADVPRLVQLGQLEHARSRFKDHPFDKLHATANMERAVAGMLTRVFISDSGLGFVGGMVQPNLFNRFFTAYELCWYAEDGSGIELLRAFEHWARGMRAVELVISNYGGISEPQKFGRVMQRAGFAHLGSSYVKKLERKHHA